MLPSMFFYFHDILAKSNERTKTVAIFLSERFPSIGIVISIPTVKSNQQNARNNPNYPFCFTKRFIVSLPTLQCKFFAYQIDSNRI